MTTFKYPSTASMDPIPTKVMIQLVGVLLPFITKIVNKLLQSGSFPDSWKEAQGLHLLQSLHLDVKYQNVSSSWLKYKLMALLLETRTFFHLHLFVILVYFLIVICLWLIISIRHACASAFYYLCNIRHIRKYISVQVTESLVHALVTSCIDHGNSLLFGLPYCQLNKLQRVPRTGGSVG